MNINGVVLEGPRGLAPNSSVAQPPAQAPAPTAPTVAAPAQVEATRDRVTQNVRQRLDTLAADQASQSRGGTRLRLDERTDGVVAQIVNKNNEVIRQLPPEEALRIAARFHDLVGLIFDKNI